MRKHVLGILGIIYVIVGLFASINSFFTITGFTIAEKASQAPISILGLALIIGGILLIFAGREEGGLEKTSDARISLISTKNFEKAIRGEDLGKINSALRKIGTGKGKEHPLKGRGDDRSIGVSRGSRIIFEYESPHAVKIKDYTTEQHDYKRH